jgi:uncharacterized protein YbjT (DUF2867 family)
VRFPHGAVTFETAIDGSARLFRAAADAGVRWIVHVSITSADVDSPYAYFRGKGLVEAQLMASGVSHAIVRPAILFGVGDAQQAQLQHTATERRNGDPRPRGKLSTRCHCNPFSAENFPPHP